MKPAYLALALLFIIIAFFLAQAIVALPLKLSQVLIIGLIFSIISMINLESGLLILVFVVPFTQQITIGQVSRIPFDVGTDDILILFLLFSWLANLVRSKQPLPLKSPLNWPLFALFAVSVFSFTGAHREFGPGPVVLGFFHLLKFFEYVAVYFIIISTIRSKEQIKRFLSLLFIIVGIVALVQFISMLKWGQLSLSAYSAGRYFFMRSMYGFQSNSILGAYYSFFVAILLAIVIDLPRTRRKPLLSIFMLVLSFALFNTLSRSAYLGLVVSFFVLACLKEKKLFLVIMLLLALSPVYMQRAVLERITLTVQSLQPRLALDPSSAIRLVLWKKGFEVFLKNAVFGTGYWTTRWAMRGEAHSQYLAVLIEIGIVGFIVYAWLVIRMLKNSLTLAKTGASGFLRSLGAGYTAGLFAILTTCFFSETLEAFRVIGPLWIVSALITSANRLPVQSSPKQQQADKEKAP